MLFGYNLPAALVLSMWGVVFMFVFMLTGSDWIMYISLFSLIAGIGFAIAEAVRLYRGRDTL